MKNNLPKIAFIGAVTFEELTGSHILFYRLFKKYPPEKLLVIGSHKSRGTDSQIKRLPNVKYYIIEEHNGFPTANHPTSKYPPVRIFQKWWHYKPFFKACKNSIIKEVEAFQPDIILSLTMNIHWYIAYLISKELKIPLDLVLHDRWEPNVGNKNVCAYLQPKFKEVFQYARKRFCISPTMERYYYRQTGIHSDVLYPIGNESTVRLEKQQKEDKNPLTVVYFGNIWGNQPSLIDLAHILDKKEMRLVLFTNRDLSFFEANGLKSKNVEANGFLKNEDLLSWCKEQADILYLPMYFDKGEQDMIQCSFPSKLVDYLSTGLPIILQAPKIASIIKFAELNKDSPFAEVLIDDNIEVLETAMQKLSDSTYRKSLGDNSLKVWKKYFSADIIRSSFLEHYKKNNIV